ncbi:hypothetical protein DN585_12435 [Intrasporangium calvum]|nr:hypothetical protein DN585_12435 [Intrasporangium calvum]
MAEGARGPATRLTTKLLPGLHVGGSWDPSPPDKGWDYVLTVCTPDEAYGSPPARKHASLWMLDAPLVDVPVVEALRDVTVDVVRSGAKTLVRCHMGLNRSALVAVLAAVEPTGDAPAKLVSQLRRRRSADVLYNETFERYALGCYSATS